MIPWVKLDTAQTPDTKNKLELYQRDTEYSIRINGQELMNSRMYGSEKKLAELACKKITSKKGKRVLIGGLGMGYTLASALDNLPVDSHITISELVPAIVEWNKKILGKLAGKPLSDRRVDVLVKDIALILKNNKVTYDAVILDVDNGPEGLTQEGNNWLYSGKGLNAVKKVLSPRGVLAVWSVSDNDDFTRRLKSSGYDTEKHTVWARDNKKGGRHTIWIAMKR